MFQQKSINKMSNPRSVVDVMDKFLQIIPDKETRLRTAIADYKKSLWNQAPEALATDHCWVPLQTILIENVGEINNEWKQELLRIFNNV